MKIALPFAASALAFALAAPAMAQDQASCRPQGMFAVANYQSVEVLEDGRVTFRICAPDAQEVRVTSSDNDEAIPMGFVPGSERGLMMARDDTGLWSVTTAVPVAADVYRFNFEVDGARVPDPMGQRFSEERVGTNSTFEVPGEEGEFQTWKADIAHGVVSEIEYWSAPLGVKRRAHVYTPPGYMAGDEHYPVLYLVHGAGDSDDSWTSVGHANQILDNLIASGDAKPMIVVMPDGHTPASEGQAMLANGAFYTDLHDVLIPLVGERFRVLEGRENRAMAGLSMGGAHTLQAGLTRPDRFAWLGVFSMGLGLGDPAAATKYGDDNAAALEQAASDLSLLYYAMGSEDFLYGAVAPTREVFDRFGIEHVYNESGGGHTWINWRRYFHDFAPRLFK